MFLLSLYFVLLYKYSGREDIVVGCGIAGRGRPELEDVIGMFVNMLPMRQYPQRDVSFLEFLGQVKERALKAYENQDYQFDQLVEKLGLKREYGRNPLFDTQFTFQDLRGKPLGNVQEHGEKDGEDEAFEVASRSMQFEFSLNGRAESHRVLLAFQYMDSLFKHSTIQGMVTHYLEILEQVLTNVESRLEEIELSHNLQKGESILTREEALDFDF